MINHEPVAGALAVKFAAKPAQAGLDAIPGLGHGGTMNGFLASAAFAARFIS